MTTHIRPATPADVPALGRMGAALAHLHHDFDSDRFMLPDNLEAGYASWLGRELKGKGAVVLVAELGGETVGYAYARLEERDWNALLDRCGVLHDLWVDEKARGTGLGAQLTEAMTRRLVELGAPRVVLSTAAKNESAQRLFTKLGWRPTMIEMTREAGPRGLASRRRGVAVPPRRRARRLGERAARNGCIEQPMHDATDAWRNQGATRPFIRTSRIRAGARAS